MRPAGATLPAGVHAQLGWAVAGFVVSAVLAILTNIPLLYAGTDAAGLRERVDERLWRGSRAVAERRTAEMWLEILQSAQLHNDVKGWLLFAATIVEVMAVALVALVAQELVAG